MAEAAVVSAVKWLANLQVEEENSSHEVGKMVEKLQDELKRMQLYLQEVDAKQDRDPDMHDWIRQISCLGDQAEDLIESFILKVDSQRHGSLMNKLKWYSCFVAKAKLLHDLSKDVEVLKQKITTLTSRLQHAGIKITNRGSTSVRKSYTLHLRSENIFGLDVDVNKLVKHLLNDNCDSRAVAIIGIGGLGKTTLAVEVFNHKDVRNQFHAFARAHMSRQCHSKIVLSEIYRGLTLQREDPYWTEEDLKKKLYDLQQQKKCLVVLDNIRTNGNWDSVKAAFPNDQENLRGGKLMLTSRNQSVAKYVDENVLIYQPCLLGDKHSWELFMTKLRCGIFEGENGDEMKSLAYEMLGNCAGVPWAIVLLGGILATKESLDQWNITKENIKSLIRDGCQSLPMMVQLYYYDFPAYLQPCFVYLGAFQEGFEISGRKLIHLWMAEGFLSASSYDDGSLEDVGYRYLEELVSRSMVEVGSTHTNGKIRTCRVDEIVREACLSIAAKKKFLKVEEGETHFTSLPSTGMSSRSAANTGERYRRLAIHDFRFDWGINAPHTKSLLFTGKNDKMKVRNSTMKKLIAQFKFLKVLDLESIEMRALPKGVGGLVYLTYLSIGGSYIEEVPSSIGKLRYLQTLDLRSQKAVRWFPDVIWRMKKLIHVYMPKDYTVAGSTKEMIRYKHACKSQWDQSLSNLEILSGFNERQRLKHVAQLTNLRKMSLNKQVYLDAEELGHLSRSESLLWDRIEHLSFGLRWEVLTEEPEALQDFMYVNVMRLKIKGFKSSSSSGGCSLGSIMLPHNVSHLSLEHTEIENSDAMGILEKLPNLRQLELGKGSYRGRDMTCSNAGFPLLTSLTLEGLEYLEEWTIEEGAMPSLVTLSIRNCKKLKGIPEGRKYIDTLRNLYSDIDPGL